ncbi:MAG: DUF1579 domain-containing protein [Planctomycetes bacterium]|nr:DUF1579 domain-containing protein [Planctomycetota bacterium]
MKLANLLCGLLAPAALAVLASLPSQDAGAAKPKAPAGGKPGGQPAAAAKQDAKPGAKPAAKPGAKPAAQPAAAVPAAQDDAASRTPGAALTKRYQDAMTQGEAHAWLAKLEGKWKTSGKLLTEANAPAVEMTGTSEFKMLMDGRFLVESHEAGGSAGPFRGMGMIGFNNITQKYERVWFDTTSTAMLKSEGEYVAEGNNLRWVDQRSDPRTSRLIETTSKLTVESDGAMTLLTMENHGSGPFKALEVHYRRE